MTPDVAVVMGTWDRRVLLQRCVASIRAAAGGLRVVCLVADGGSVDGSREWLAEQPDCELLEGGRAGAVAAFNVAFARAVDLGAPWVCQFNDDIEFTGDGGERELERAAALLAAHEPLGCVAFNSDRYGEWRFERVHGLAYANQGLWRRATGMACARAQGDPEGKAWWDRRFHTYASDTILGLWCWRLGWGIHEAVDIRVHEAFSADFKAGRITDDPLRARNVALYTNGEEFGRQWGDPRSVAYSRADAERCGGRLL